MQPITHGITHIRSWFGIASLTRTLATAGLIPITNEGLLYNAETRLNELDGTSAKGYFKANSKEDSQHKLSLINGNIVESYFDMDSGHYEETRYKYPRVGQSGETKMLSNKMTLVNFDHYAGKEGNDIAYGNSGDNTMEGGSGKNYLNGREGNDRIQFGYGNDIIVGGAGRSDRAEFIRNGILKVEDVIRFETGDSIDGVDLKDNGLYLIIENRGKKTYIHESTEFIISAEVDSYSRKTFGQLRHTRFDVVDPNQEATREHFMVGTLKSEDFYGGAGRDNITGAGGRDKFHLDVFDRSSDSWTNMDRIIDLDGNDKIVIHSTLLGINPDEAGFEVVSNNQERASAMRDENVHFAYDTRSGDIFWDSNGANGGGGKGLAKLVGDSEFSGINQIELI